MSNNLINSFDLWDTLITRNLPFPKDVFTIIENHYGIENFAKKRIKAENFLYESVPNPSIDDIYKLLELDFEDLEYIKTLELSIENILTERIDENSSLLRDSDIVISDMYLNSTYLFDIAKEKVPNLKIGNIFSSCDLNLSKKEGNIYNYISSNYRLKGHIGDHYQSDYLNAIGSGIRATHYSSSRFSKYENDLLKYKNTYYLAGALRSCRLSNFKNSTNPLIEFYRNIFYPMLTIFVRELLDVSKSNGIKKIFFLSRDGFIPYKIATDLFKDDYADIECVYLKVSRKTLQSLEKSGFDEKNSTYRYLKLCGFFNEPETKIAIVDAGWHGSMQLSLNKARNSAGLEDIEIGFYLGVTPPFFEEIKNSYSTFLFDNLKHKSEFGIFAKYISLIEHLLFAPHGSVVDYIINETNEINVVYNSESSFVQNEVESLLLELTTFLNISKKLKSFSIHTLDRDYETKDFFLNRLLNTFLFPSKALASSFNSNKHSDNFSNSVELNIVNKEHSFFDFLLKRELNIVWEEGSMVCSDNIFLKFLLLIRGKKKLFYSFLKKRL